MKTPTEIKFNLIIKDVFHGTLKPLGYKKKGNNFYLKGNGIGKIINIQKSSFYSKDYIKFTINTGIFSPEFFNGYYDYPGKAIPTYPIEPVCIIRRRIGRILDTKDIWYSIDVDTDIEKLKTEQQYILTEFIIPYFNRINSNNDIIKELNHCRPTDAVPTAKYILLKALDRHEEATREYLKLNNKED